jgi:general secretion pathway protein L
MGRKILALDIRENGLSAVLMANSLKGNRIEAHTHIPLSALAKEGEATDPLGDALKTLAAEINAAGSETVVSIPPGWISFRNLKTPFKDRKKIKQVLPFEMEPLLPYPIEAVTTDFLSIPHGDETDILAATVETEKLNRILEILRSYGMDPRIVTGGGMPAAICLSRLSASMKDFFFIDLDEKTATIFACLSGQVHTARCFQYGSDDPIKKATRLYQGILQMRASFESFFNHSVEPSAVVISENGFDDGNLAKEMGRLLDLPVKQADLLKDLDLNIQSSGAEGFASDRMNNAIGLAALDILGTRTINFLGERSVFLRYWEEYKNEIVKTGFIAAFVFILVLFDVLVDAYFLQKRVDSLNRQIAFIFQSTFPDVKKIVDPAQQMRIRIQQAKEENRFAGELENERLNIDMLNEMSRLIPDSLDVEITHFVRSEDSILISGSTDTFNAVDEIKGRLEKAKPFGKITISSANQDKTTNRIQFKLKVEL